MSLSVVLVAMVMLLAVGYLALAGYVWRYRAITGARALIVMILAVAWWTICYAGELLSSSVSVAMFWSAAKFVGIVLLPPAWLTFVMQYTGRAGLLPRRVLLGVAVVPAALLAVLAVPATHDLFHYYPDRPDRLYGSPIPLSGPLFWPFAAYTYLMMSLAVGLLVVRLVRVARQYRRAATVIVVFSVLPLVGNLLYNVWLYRIPIPDPTPALLGLTGVVLVWGFLRVRLIDLGSVARHAVVDQMADGLLVLDPYDRMADANPSACRMLGVSGPADLVGRAVADLPGIGPLVADSAGGRHSLDARVGRGEHRRDLSLLITDVLDDVGRRSARVVVLRDITDRTRAERRLRELLDEQTELNQTLQSGLRPVVLPVIPGLRLAARSIPAAPGGQLSGDFYDVHRAHGGHWAFALGDVSGKGVHAAVVTSLARYALRTLSSQPWSPQGLMQQLNQTLRMGSEDPERFCTVAYGRLGPSSHGPGLRLVLTLGGHPQPLLCRRDGTVTRIGVPGTVLGLFPEAEVHEVAVDLEPGDTVVAFTDGVTEARRDGEEFGEERLAALVAEVAADGRNPSPSQGPQRAQQTADAVADSVLVAVEDFGVDRDDVALLVMTVTDELPEELPGEPVAEIVTPVTPVTSVAEIVTPVTPG